MYAGPGLFYLPVLLFLARLLQGGLTIFLMSGLMLLHAALGIAAIYYGESTLFGRIHIGIMFGLGLGALFGVYSLIRAQFSMLQKARATVLGRGTEADHISYP